MVHRSSFTADVVDQTRKQTQKEEKLAHLQAYHSLENFFKMTKKQKKTAAATPNSKVLLLKFFVF